MQRLNKKIEELLKDPEETIKEIYEAVEEQLGFVPSILRSMVERPDILIPSVLAAYTLLGEPKALDRKTAELIAFASAVAVRGEACTKVHLNAAQKAGATKEELFEALMIGSLMAQTAVQASAFKVYKGEIKNGDYQG
jgi:AhpD family alkylhydroperoxidase